jgi:hypothetical protein
MANIISNHFRYLLATKAVSFLADAFKIILMDNTFVYSPATYDNYADISAKELTTLHGYTVGGISLSGVAVVEDDANNVCNVTWAAVNWTASGGVIGPTVGAIIFDDTVANDPIVGYIDFGGAYTQASGGVLVLSGLGYTL